VSVPASRQLATVLRAALGATDDAVRVWPAATGAGTPDDGYALVEIGGVTYQVPSVLGAFNRDPDTGEQVGGETAYLLVTHDSILAVGRPNLPEYELPPIYSGGGPTTAVPVATATWDITLEDDPDGFSTMIPVAPEGAFHTNASSVFSLDSFDFLTATLGGTYNIDVEFGFIFEAANFDRAPIDTAEFLYGIHAVEADHGQSILSYRLTPPLLRPPAAGPLDNYHLTFELSETRVFSADPFAGFIPTGIVTPALAALDSEVVYGEAIARVYRASTGSPYPAAPLARSGRAEPPPLAWLADRLERRRS
jgi:hypothetical protein